jgi:hypothetical protein
MALQPILSSNFITQNSIIMRLHLLLSFMIIIATKWQCNVAVLASLFGKYHFPHVALLIFAHFARLINTYEDCNIAQSPQLFILEMVTLPMHVAPTG